MGFASGTRLGPYEVLHLLGAGGMGEVYRARDPRLGREVAVKVLPADVSGDPPRLARFEQEARAVAALNHPNILTVFDVGTDAGSGISPGAIPYVVTELLEGETVRERLRRQPPTMRQVLSLAVPIARGLEAAHAKGIVHRDLKPENVFVTTDGRVKVLDFGLAKRRGDGGADSRAATAESPTGEGHVVGTVGYMSPEQVRGLTVDHRTDVFSLGVVLYELLGGRHPFQRETAAETIAAILEEEPPELSALGRGVPPALSGIVRRCLSKERDERFRSAHDLAIALEAVLDAPTGAASLHEAEERGPYPGLSSFTERDAGFFVGREAEVRALWEKLAARRLLAVIAPSGAGKTSLVRAGVIASRPDGWAAVVATPGASPFRGLGRALVPELSGDPESLGALVDVDDPAVALDILSRWRRRHGEALLVVDQLEELFTLSPPEVQGRFAALLGRLATEADVHVLLAMRDDFLIRCSEHEPLAPIFRDLTPLAALTREGLVRALVEPAKKRGVRFEEPALVEEMIASVEGSRGALPLLAFAVSRLWEERDRERKLLTRSAYEAIGGVAGALALHAEATMDRIGPERQEVVREVFRNLVTAHGTRAVADRDELLSVFPDRKAAEEVLRDLIDARLLTSYEVAAAEGQSPHHRVEVAHESLLRAWPRLVRWQAQDEEGAVLRDQLRQAAHLWDEKGRTSDLLWTGTAFREFDLWRERYPGALTAVEENFARAMAEKARRRKRLLTAAVASVIVGLAGVAIAVSVSRYQAARARDQATAQALRAEASKLVALGRAAMETDPAEALAHAGKSLEMSDTVEARLLALEALWRGPGVRSLRVDGIDCSRIAFSPDARRIACSGFTPGVATIAIDGSTRRFDVQPTMADARSVVPTREGRLLTWLPGDDRIRELSPEGQELRSYPGEVHFLRTLPDGSFVTCGPFQPGARELVIRRWTPGPTVPVVLGRWTPRPGMRFDQPGVRPLDVDPHLRFFAYGWEDGVYVRTLGPSPPADVRVSRLRGRLRELLFDDAGDHLAAIDEAGDARVWTVPSWRLRHSLAAVRTPRFSLLAFSADGRQLAWDTGAEGLLLWDLLGPPDVTPLVLRRGGVGLAGQQVFSSDGRWLAGGGLRGSVDLRPLGLPYSRVLRGHAEGPIERLAFNNDSRVLVSCARDGARLWPMTPDGGRQRLIAVGGDYMCYELGVDPSTGDLVVAAPFRGIYRTGADGGSVRKVVDLAGRRLALSGIAFDPSRRRMAVGSSYAPPPGELSLFVLAPDGRESPTFPLRRGSVDEPYSGAVVDMAFAPDGSLLTAGDGGVKRWNLHDGTAKTVYGGPGRFAALAASRDGRRAVALVGTDTGGSTMGEAETVLIDLRTGAHRVVPGRGQRLVHAVALDGTGERIVTADPSGAVRVGRTSGEEPHLLLGHVGLVSDVAVSPDGKWIASASGSEIRLWPMPDVSKPPLHTLPHDVLMARLGALTNLRVIPDAASATGYSVEIGPFPGWKDVPAW